MVELQKYGSEDIWAEMRTYVNAGIPGTGIYTRQKINDGLNPQRGEIEEIEIDVEKHLDDVKHPVKIHQKSIQNLSTINNKS